MRYYTCFRKGSVSEYFWEGNTRSYLDVKGMTGGIVIVPDAELVVLEVPTSEGRDVEVLGKVEGGDVASEDAEVWEVTVVAVETVDDTVELVDETNGPFSRLITLSSKVIDPPRPNSPPFEMAPVFKVIEAAARMFPAKTLVTPSVAEDPTCQ